MAQEITQANKNTNAVYVIANAGESVLKERVLNSLPTVFAANHRNMLVYLHDLEYYAVTYNCIGVSVQNLVGDKPYTFSAMLRELYRKIVDLTNWQSGGIGFINFDGDAAQYIIDESDAQICEALQEFFLDLNMNVRKGCEKAYVTFNFGLDTSNNGRRLSKLLLDTYLQGDEQGHPLVFPNLVFKLKSGVNVESDAVNYDVYQKALAVTAKRMVPTYFNCDSSSNKEFPAERLGIMGCRTRVAVNLHGQEGALNRGNVASVTLNLVQMAYKANGDVQEFYHQLDQALLAARDVLLHRYHTLCRESNFAGYYEKGYYLDAEQKQTEAMLKHGTLAIGFIGLWDALVVLHNTVIDSAKFLETHCDEAEAIVRYMRAFTDQCVEQYQLNFSLLATAAEGVTGQFAEHDRLQFGEQQFVGQNGFYTNSFHTPVDVKLGYRKKIELEGKFHALCNGGSITYIELQGMPNRNVAAVQEIVEYAYQQDCNYIGINFPLDICKECGYVGRINDTCPHCNSWKVSKLRRVSGYLAEEDKFTKGKKCELQHRVSQMELI